MPYFSMLGPVQPPNLNFNRPRTVLTLFCDSPCLRPAKPDAHQGAGEFRVVKARLRQQLLNLGNCCQ